MEVNVGFALMLTTLAGLATGIGGAIAYFIRRPTYSFLAIMLAFSAGVMVYISFAELLKTAIEEVGFGTANIAFFAGILFIGIIDILVPHEYKEERVTKRQQRVTGESSVGERSVLMRAGMFTALGIAIHNFPEGLAVFGSAATGDVTLGIAVALAIAIHNVPEGISVAVPIFYATSSRGKAFIYSFSSGLAEPVGALIGYAILLPFISPMVLSSLLAFVAGIMIYISLDELLPLAHRYGREHLVIAGIGAGMLIMAFGLFILRQLA